MTIAELKSQRNRIEDRLKRYYRKHYDGRALLKAYQDITELLRSSGKNVGLIPHDYTSIQYWDKESSRDREHFNKNPIIGVDENFDFIWRHGEPGIAKKARQAKGKPLPAINNQLKESKPIQDRYYRINVEWDSNIPNQQIDFILRFFDDMGLEPLASQHGRSFRFDGTDEGLQLLKRAALVSLDILSKNPINIGIYSEIIT